MGGAIEIAIATLNQSGIRIGAIGIIKRIQGAQQATGRNPENRAIELIALDHVVFCHAVEIAIGSLNQRAHRHITIPAARE